MKNKKRNIEGCSPTIGTNNLIGYEIASTSITQNVFFALSKYIYKLPWTHSRY